jgi:hypothetical protein
MLKISKIVKGSFLERDAIDQRESTRGDSRADFILAVRSQSIKRRLRCKVKSNGQPRRAREACLTLRYYIRSDVRDYPVFIAPYIVPAAAAVGDPGRTGWENPFIG